MTAQDGSPSGANTAGGANHTADPDNQGVVVGKIASPFGVKGWTKVVSYTQPLAGLMEYNNWQLSKGRMRRTVDVQQGREHGKFLVVKFREIDDREQVALLTNAEVIVARDQFAETEQGDYYWADLIGLRVFTTTGVELGVIDSLFETGANDVMVVKGERERLVPWIVPDVVTSVELDAGRMTVDWDPDF